MVHLGPLTPPEPARADATEGWTLDHQLHALAQTETRPGPLTDEGERWMDRQHTGKVMIVCTCGYSSGLIDRTELTSTLAGLAEEHTGRPIAPNVNQTAQERAGQTDLI